MAMKKAKPKKKPASYWRNKCDEIFMARYHGRPCAVCLSIGHIVNDNVVGHHLIPKSRCNYHRYTDRNILPLCPRHHLLDNWLSAHSMNSLAVERFLRWLRAHHPERYDWIVEHERDSGKLDYEDIYRRLTGEHGDELHQAASVKARIVSGRKGRGRAGGSEPVEPRSGWTHRGAFSGVLA